MLGRIRFYCPECKKFEDRRGVKADEWEMTYYCKWCGNNVIQTKLVIKEMVKDYIDYIISKGKGEDFE